MFGIERESFSWDELGSILGKNTKQLTKGMNLVNECVPCGTRSLGHVLLWEFFLSTSKRKWTTSGSFRDALGKDFIQVSLSPKVNWIQRILGILLIPYYLDGILLLLYKKNIILVSFLLMFSTWSLCSVVLFFFMGFFTSTNGNCLFHLGVLRSSHCVATY